MCFEFIVLDNFNVVINWTFKTIIQCEVGDCRHVPIFKQEFMEMN